MKRNDLRVVRTKHNLEKALLDLMQKKKLQDIQIKELTELAMVSRQTFYKHYNIIEDLYVESLSRVFEEICSEDDKEIRMTNQTERMFDLIYLHRDKLKILLRVKNKDLFINSYYTIIKKIYVDNKSYNNELYTNDNLKDLRFFVAAGATYTFIREWLVYNDSESPEKMAKIFNDILIRTN